MAPKKNAADLPQKVAKKRPPKENTAKAKLKTPTIIKIRIGSPPKLARKVTAEQRIELANEVIQTQLAKTAPEKVVIPVDPKCLLGVENFPNKPIKECTSIKKTLRKRKATAAIDSDLLKEDLTEPTPKRKRKAKVTYSSTMLSDPGSDNAALAKMKIIKNGAPNDVENGFQKKPGPLSKTMNMIPTVDIPLMKLQENGDCLKKPIQILKKTSKKVRQKKKPGEPANEENVLEPQDVNPPPKKRVKKKQIPKKVTESKCPKKSPKAVKKPRGRPKFVSERSNDHVSKRTRGKGKVLNAEQIKDAALKLDNALATINNGAGLIQTRSNSIASNNSYLSWTKDISSSSTTTCVTVSSHDFVRVDKKLPIIQLNNILTQNKSKEMIEDSSSSDSDSSNSSVSNVITRPDLNLSTSSMSQKSEDLNNTELLTIEIEKLTESMKRFESLMGKYLDMSEENDLNQLGTDTAEAELMMAACEDLTVLVEKEPVENPKSPEFAKPSAVRRPSVAEPSQVTPVTVHSHAEKGCILGSSETVTADNHHYIPYDVINDDEDALSLFAESITGIESSKLSTTVSNASVAHEPYVPKQLTPVQEYTYKPTKIEEPKKPVCEYQNADSTSISKEIEAKVDIPATEKANTNGSTTPENPRPQLLKETYTPANPIRSLVYKGLCFFHVSSFCKNFLCRFPHIQPDIDTIQYRIATLPEKEFIQEYLLTSNFPTLRKKFGLLFVTDCLSREATRILVEMAIDFSYTPLDREERDIQVAALELTLLHLNQISFDACDDLLKYPVGKTLLCHVLLRCIADSQNFARFTPVFMKLAEFLEEIEKPADSDVVGKILERVCILPSDERLARAMLSLIKNTDPTIFDNGMMDTFETHLSNLLDSGVFDDYLLCKMARKNVSVPEPAKDRERYTSPDTTNLDGSIKAVVQPPTITRTVDFTQPNTTPVMSLFKSPAMPAPRRSLLPASRGSTWRHICRQEAMKGYQSPLRGRQGSMRGYQGPMRGHRGPLRGHPGSLRGYQCNIDRKVYRKPTYNGNRRDT